jgi:hypothetical protein
MKTLIMVSSAGKRRFTSVHRKIEGHHALVLRGRCEPLAGRMDKDAKENGTSIAFAPE